MSDRLRLHISPLNPTLLAALIPPAALKDAKDISYHTLETFPERNYGYVELPRSEAEKMKTKYNGSILKGAKVHIEEAREKKQRPETNDTPPDSDKRKHKRVKSTVREDGVLPGFELPADRQVQRGWTTPASQSKTGKTPKDKKLKPQTSSFTSKECLFKTTLPAHVASANASKPEPKSKSGKRKREGKIKEQVVVHEFSNTTKQPSFIRDASAGKGTKIVSEFVEGKGWVDEKGGLIEDVQVRRSKKRAAAQRESEAVSEGAQAPEPQITNSVSRKRSQIVKVENKQPTPNVDDETSSSGTSSGTESSEEDDESVSSNENDESAAENADGTPNGGIIAKDIHPLEAIFKRPKQKISPETPKPSLKVSTSFNFFEPDADDATGPPAMPQTPFTQQDFQERRQRSAAPTPDTAAPGKTFSRLWLNDDGEDDLASEGSLEDADAQLGKSTELHDGESTSNTGEAAERPQSEFAKWFWEHRGETNRAWKKRRREAAKENRHRENKRHGRSVV